MGTRHLVVNVSLLLLVVVGSRVAWAQQSTAAARASVDSWLTLVDGQQYAKSWQAAATFFKNAVTAEKWQEAAKTARVPLGSLQSRAVKSVTPAKTLPGAPDGDYVVFQFNTRFQQKAAALETVTVVRESDGNWRIVGYFIK